MDGHTRELLRRLLVANRRIADGEAVDAAGFMLDGLSEVVDDRVGALEATVRAAEQQADEMRAAR